MMRRKDENGFTLVELVISMGMFSIVMLAIMFFLTAGTKSYGHSKSELNLQMESQMLLNQIRVSRIHPIMPNMTAHIRR